MRAVSILFVLSFPLISFSQAQTRISPLSVVTDRHQDTYVKIVYSSPSKKGREIFGGLVPFGQVWRTGANEATEITLTKDVVVNGKPLKKGTYALFTIPNKDKWTIIFNADLGLWGSYNYSAKKDVLRFDVSTTSTDHIYESFTIAIESKGNQADVELMWDKTKVSFPIQYVAAKPEQ